jgi:hypothetical protein
MVWWLPPLTNGFLISPVIKLRRKTVNLSLQSFPPEHFHLPNTQLCFVMDEKTVVVHHHSWYPLVSIHPQLKACSCITGPCIQKFLALTHTNHSQTISLMSLLLLFLGFRLIEYCYNFATDFSFPIWVLTSHTLPSFLPSHSCRNLLLTN